MAETTPIAPAPNDRNAARANALYRALNNATRAFDEVIKQRDMAELAGDQRRQRALQLEIDQLNKRLADPKVSNAFKEPLGDAYSAGFNQKDFGKTAPISAINKEQIEALADGFVKTAQSTMSKTKSVLPYIASKILNADEMDLIREAAIEATARGLSSKEFAKKLMAPGMPVEARMFEEDGRLWVAVNANRRMPADVYADSMARTLTYHAANRGTLTRCDDLGIETVLVAKNPGTIDFCLALEGKVYALTAAAAERFQLPLLADCPNGGPPFHPNCRHSIAPFPMTKAKAGKVPTAPKEVLTRDQGRDARKAAQDAFLKRLKNDPTEYADVIGESAARRGFGTATKKVPAELVGSKIPGTKEEFGSRAPAEDVVMAERKDDGSATTRKELRQRIADTIRADKSPRSTEDGMLEYRADGWIVTVDPPHGLVIDARPE